MSGQIRRQSPGAVWVVVLILVGLFAIDAPPTQATFSLASITNNPNSNQIGYLQFEATLPSGAQTTCVARGAGPASCGGNVFAQSAATTTPAGLASSATNRNPITPTGVVQQVRIAKCSPTQFVNTGDGNVNPMLVRNRVTRQVADPWGTTSAASFSGAQQYAGALLPVNPAELASVSYTLGGWFKLPLASQGGPILSLGPNPLNAAIGGVPANPVVYFSSGGNPRFVGQSGQNPVNVDSPTSFRDNQWHFLAVTVDRSVTSSTITMYVDGQVVVAKGNLPLLTGATGNYYWKIGWMDFPGLQGNPVNFNGSASGVFVAQNAATPAQISAMYTAGSASAYAAAISNKRQLWMLGEPVTTTWDGAVPYVDTPGDPCSKVDISWSIGTSAAMGATSIAAHENGGWQPPGGIATPAVGTSVVNQTYYRRAASYDSDLIGMELLVVAEFRYFLSPNWSTVMSFDRQVLLA